MRSNSLQVGMCSDLSCSFSSNDQSWFAGLLLLGGVDPRSLACKQCRGCPVTAQLRSLGPLPGAQLPALSETIPSSAG